MLGLGKIETKFVLVIFTAVIVYIYINFFSSKSVFSVKVGMFIQMHDVQDTLLNGSSKQYTPHSSVTDTSKSLLRHPYKQHSNHTRETTLQSVASFQGETEEKQRNEFDNDDIVIIDLDRNSTVASFHGRHGPGQPIHLSNDSIVRKVTQNKNSSEDNHINGTKNSDKSVERFLQVFPRNGTTLRPINGNLINATAGETERRNINLTQTSILGHINNKTRRDECDKCFQHNFDYVIENDICKLFNTGDEIELLILITTAHNHVRARSALRETWLSFTRKNTANVRYAFLLGETTDSSYRGYILEEDRYFHDIIKEDFIDSYMNLTYKTIMGFKWAATKCAHAKFVMKTDDDMFVNIPNVLKLIESSFGYSMQTSLTGACILKARPIRDFRSKWFASQESYPHDIYPSFCSGTGYVTSMNVVSQIYQVSPNVPFFHLEDVYVGLCLKKLGFTVKHVRGFNAGRPRLKLCLFKGNRLLTAHQMTPGLLRAIWKRQCLPVPPL